MGRYHPSYREMQAAMEDDVEIEQHDGFTVNDRRGMKGLETCRACGLRHDGGAVRYKVQPMESCIEAYRTRLTRLRYAANECIEMLGWHADDDAEPDDETPHDHTAHINGLCRRILREAVEGSERP